SLPSAVIARFMRATQSDRHGKAGEFLGGRRRRLGPPNKSGDDGGGAGGMAAGGRPHKAVIRGFADRRNLADPSGIAPCRNLAWVPEIAASRRPGMTVRWVGARRRSALSSLSGVQR